MCDTEIHHVFGTSSGRDQDLHPLCNSYTLELQTPIKDVQKVELLFASVPNPHPSSNTFAFLDIEELRTTLNHGAGSSLINRSFGLIPLDVATGTLKTFKAATDFEFEVQYPYPIRKLSKLTVRWLDRNGNLLNIGAGDTTTFVLRIHTARTNLC